MSNGGFIGLTKQNGDGKIDGIGGRNTSPIGETSIFYNESLDGIPRQEDLFAVRVLGQTSQIEWIKDKAKSQIASTEFSVIPDVPEDEDREPSDREIEAARNIEQFFRGEFNDNNTSEDALHGQLLDDIFDMNSGVLELVPDNEGYVKKMLVHDGLTFTINQNEHGELPEPDAEEPAYYQFSLASHAKQFFRSDRQGIDVRELREKMHQMPFTKIFNRDQKEFGRDQIVWFSEPQNEKTYTPYGRGRTQKVKDYAEVMINGDMHRNRFFLDNEFHKGVLAVDNNTSQKDKESLRKRFKNSAGNEHELPVVGGAENMDYISIDPDPEAMQFLESQKWYTRSVLRAYGLNDVAGGLLEDANKGISDNAKQQIFRQVTGPILNMFEKKWNNEVLPFMREYEAVDGNVKFVYEPENRFLQRIENEIIDQELNNGTLTINEARERKGKEPFGAVGDLPKTAFEKLANSVPDYVAENLNDELEDVPSGGSGAENPFELTVNNEESSKQPQKIEVNTGEGGSSTQTNNPDQEDNEEKEGDGSGSTDPLDITNYREAFENKDQVLEQTKDALRNERGFNDVPGIVQHKEEMKEDVSKVFEKSIDLEQELENSFPDESQENGVLVDADKIVENLDFKDRLASELETNNLGALEMSAEHHEGEIEDETEERLTIPEESKVEISFDVMDTFTADIIRQEAFRSATEIQDSVKDRLKNELLKGAEKGEGIPQIKDRIQNTVDSISGDHAELVARTETLQSSRKGSQALAESTDLVGGKEWLSTDDARVRKWHEVMDGQIVPKDNMFTVPQTSDSSQPSDYPRTARVVGEDQPFNCFDNKTEVLTENGWKLFRNVEKDERVYTFNMETQGLELQETTGYIEKEVDEILRYEGESVSIGATPEHDMVVTYGADPKKRTLGDIKENNNTYVNIPNETKGLIGKHPETYTIEKVNGEHEYQDEMYKDEWAEKEIPIETWAEFLGVYLGDGFTTINDKGYSTRIAATKERKQEHAKELLDKMGYDYHVTDTTVIVENKQLALETKELSKGANNKTVPDYVFEWDRELVDIFLDGYTSTDGNVTEYGSRRIWTTSEEMADQLQQLFILTGKDASIIKQERDKVEIVDKEVDASDLYCIQERKLENKSISQRENEIEEVEYNGKVRCLETPNGTLMVRRNKKAIIAGNCRCSQAPVLAEDMPDSPQQLEASFDGVSVDLGVTERQFEVWKEHGQEFESFEKFWKTKTEEMSKSEIAESFEMSKTTVYSWSDNNE